MHLPPPDELRRCIDLARDLQEQYQLHAQVGNVTCKDVDGDLLRLIRDYLQKKVIVMDVPRMKNSVSAMYALADDGIYEVYLYEGLLENERRINLCKELFHVVIDEDKYHSTLLYEHVSEILADFPGTESQPKLATHSELLAEVAAMEFMFPYADRKHIRSEDADPDYGRIASRYGIPQEFAEKYCSDRYMKYLSAFHESDD